MRRSVLILGLVVAAAVGGLAVWHQVNRVHFTQTLCEAGLPNLSRPAVVDADDLECTVLGPKRRVSGFVETAFEHSVLVTGELYPAESRPAPWFSLTEGVMERGGAALRRELDTPVPGLCGLRVAGIVADGWLTESPGRFGHLGIASQEFHAHRILEVHRPAAEDLAAFRRAQAEREARDPGLAAFCRQLERGEFFPS